MVAKVPHLRVVSKNINNPEENNGIQAATRAEQISYLADMIQELKVMADKSGLPTLSGILEVAHIEAKSHARNI